MARSAVLTPVEREASLRSATEAHDKELADVAALEAKSADQAAAKLAAAQVETAALAARQEAETKADAAKKALEAEEVARAATLLRAEEASKASDLLLQAREKARKNGQAIAAAYDEHESAMLYNKIIELINQNPFLHPQVSIFALEMALSTTVQKARKRYGIPG